MTSKEKIEKAWELINNKRLETNEEIQLVRYAVRRARDLVDRDVPMLPINLVDSINCPKCQSYVYQPQEYCEHCGQHLNWNEYSNQYFQHLDWSEKNEN